MRLFFRTVAEFCCLVAVLLLLHQLAVPLANPDIIAGRGNRYLPLLVELHSGQTQSPRLLPVGLEMHASEILATLALTGWSVLVVGRLSLPVGATALVCTAIWLLGLAVLPVPLLESGHRTPATIAAICLLLFVPLAARLTGGRKMAWQLPQQAARFWLYPLWVLLTGIGLLWLIDYSARASFIYWNLATQHFYGLLIANFLMTVGASLAPTGMTILARWLARVDGMPQPAVQTMQRLPVRLFKAIAPRTALVIVLIVWAAGVLITVGLNPSQSALRAELIRSSTCLIGGWLAFRWLDNAGVNSALRGATTAALVFFFAVIAMAMSRDNGQILLLILASTVLLGAFIGAFCSRTRLATLLGSSVALVLLAGALYALFEWGPLVSPTVAKRVAALTESFSSNYEYLSEIRWFLASAPPGGYGLGQTPWCGTLPSLTDATSCPGMPKETHSDYFAAAIAGVWGSSAAWFISAATTLFFWGLMHPRKPRGASSFAPDPHRLAQWILAVFVGVSLLQMFVTFAGSVGLLPLTGVTFPLMSYGKASLVITALFASLAMNKPTTQYN